MPLENDAIKKIGKEYWRRNVPYIEIAEGLELGSKSFFEEVDKKRYFENPYIPPLIRSATHFQMNVLEVGCGLGSDLRTFAKFGGNVIGIDLVKNNVYVSKYGLKKLSLEAEVLVADAERLPFKNSSFELVYSFGVLHHTPNTQDAINEIGRVLGDRGSAIVMLYHGGLLKHVLTRFLRSFQSRMTKKNMPLQERTPLVKFYTKKDVRRMFLRFKETDFMCANPYSMREDKLEKIIWNFLKVSPSPIANVLGAFLIIRAKKE